jgi:uncharacterized protein YkwD
MVRKSFLVAAIVSLACLTTAPSALAAGIAQGRAVVSPARAPEAADSLIAPVAACPGQTRFDAPASTQQRAMRCMTDFARERAGLPTLVVAEQLDASARGKSDDILRCDDFSHFACGREFTYWIEASGYLSASCWRAGENLAWGTGEEGTVRSIFRAWMRSPGHRQNVLGNFSQLGISLQVGELVGLSETHVWTQHFGSHCEPA